MKENCFHSQFLIVKTENLLDFLPPYVHEISVCIFVFRFYKSDGNGN